jgi:hypothetical protein
MAANDVGAQHMEAVMSCTCHCHQLRAVDPHLPFGPSIRGPASIMITGHLSLSEKLARPPKWLDIISIKEGPGFASRCIRSLLVSIWTILGPSRWIGPISRARNQLLHKTIHVQHTLISDRIRFPCSAFVLSTWISGSKDPPDFQTVLVLFLWYFA